MSRIRARPHELFDCAEWMDSDGGVWGKDAGDSSASVHGSSGEIETKTLLYLLSQGRVAVKAVVPRDPSSLIDKFIQVSDQQPAQASSQEYIPYWVQVRSETRPGAPRPGAPRRGARSVVRSRRGAVLLSCAATPGQTGGGAVVVRRQCLCTFPASYPRRHAWGRLRRRGLGADAVEVTDDARCLKECSRVGDVC